MVERKIPKKDVVYNAAGILSDLRNPIKILEDNVKSYLKMCIELSHTYLAIQMHFHQFIPKKSRSRMHFVVTVVFIWLFQPTNNDCNR